MFFSLPLIAETAFAALISGSFDGSYQQLTPSGTFTGFYAVSPAFSVSPYELPLVVVKAGKFKETEPFTNVFEGDLALAVITQIDDDATLNPVMTHDLKVSGLYNLFFGFDSLQSGVEAANFHLFGMVPTNYDHELIEREKGRELVTMLEYKITCCNIGNS